MSFTAKAWTDYPSTTTPLNAAALVDLETRVTAYASALVTPVSHTTRTTNLVTASTTESAGTTVITAPAFTANGTDVYEIEFFCAGVAVPPSASVFVSVFEGATQIGRIAVIGNPDSVASLTIPVKGKYRLTPTAASHTYVVTAHHATSAATFNCGSGGTAAYLPAYFRITKTI